MKKLFITCAFAAAAVSALVLIGVRSAETPNLGEMDKDGAKVCVLADDCNWGEQVPLELTGTVQVAPGVTLKQFIKESIDDLIRVLEREGLIPFGSYLDAAISELKKDDLVVIAYNPGGNPGTFWTLFQYYADMNIQVEVRGDCMSACTLIVGAIDKSKLCFGPNGKLHFHQAALPSSDDNSVSVSPETTQWLFDRYPSDIQNWIGNVENLPAEGFWTLHAQDLWKMGYHKCAAAFLDRGMGASPASRNEAQTLPLPVSPVPRD
jgi:hypothetical protein